MSHFTVLVIGPNPEKQLAPYDEQLEVEPHVDECWDCEGDPAHQPCKSCGGTGKVTSTSNPDGKWDYWRIGGRFPGFLRLRPGAGRADQVLRGAVDLDQIKAECWDGERPYRTYAVVAEGAWKGYGDMGWFGQSRDERMSDHEWVEWWDRLVGGLPDDTLLTVVDCHV